MIDKKIIKACIKGDRVAHKQLYQSCAPYIYTVVRSYVKDEVFIKDVMQDAFASIFLSIHQYDASKGSFKSWVAKISTYRSIDFLRKHQRIEINYELEVVDYLSEDDFAHLDQLSKRDIETLLEEMPQGYKTIFLLHAIDDFSHKEIGKLLDISPETSRSQYHRSLKWIKKNTLITSNQIRYEAF